MTLDELKGIYRTYHNRALKNEELKDMGDAWKGMSREQFISDTVLPSEEYITAPTKQAQKLLKPVGEAYKKSTAAQRKGLDVDFGAIKTRLKEEAGLAESGLTSKFANYNLLQSGATAAGLGKIASDTTQNISKADINRQISQADLTLKEAGFMSDLGGQTTSNLTNTLENRRGKNMALDLNQQELGMRKELQKWNIDLSKITKATDLYTTPDVISNMYDSNPDFLKQLLESLGYTVT